LTGRLSCVSFCALTLAGCSGLGGAPDGDPLFRYDCGNFGRATFRVTGNESAELVLGTTRYPLRQERAASGAKYTGPGVQFWSRGSEAMLVVDQKTGQCRQSEGS